MGSEHVISHIKLRPCFIQQTRAHARVRLLLAFPSTQSESKDLYDEVDEEDYRKVVTGRLAQDDFIEDDDGGGYADDGREDWGRGREGERGGRG
jgi:hypothetical protein